MEEPLLSSSVQAPLPAGTVVGKYTLLRRLAVGGMAEIYLAHTVGIEGFQKTVVLKRILPQLSSDDSIVGMFLQEARLAATLSHPNIVQVHEMGLAGGSYFFTMEYVPGVDARAVFRRSLATRAAIPVDQIVAIGAAAAAGLHHAHEQKTSDGRPLAIVHRDISPSNLLISVSGVVKVADFGIAKAAVGHAETRTGSMKGKISYMSPEQCRGLPLDRRSDLFSLGVVLHELLTGERLYAHANDYEAMTVIVTKDAAAPSTTRLDCPRELDDIVMRCLARTPELRYATAEELQIDLEGYAREARLDVSTVALGRYVREIVAEMQLPEPAVEPVRNADATLSAHGGKPPAHAAARPERGPLALPDPSLISSAPIEAVPTPAVVARRSGGRARALLAVLGLAAAASVVGAIAVERDRSTVVPLVTPPPLRAGLLAPPEAPPLERAAPPVPTVERKVATMPPELVARPSHASGAAHRGRSARARAVALVPVAPAATVPPPPVKADVPAKHVEDKPARAKPDLDSWYAQ